MLELDFVWVGVLLVGGAEHKLSPLDYYFLHNHHIIETGFIENEEKLYSTLNSSAVLNIIFNKRYDESFRGLLWY